jgi:hypothetical protein
MLPIILFINHFLNLICPWYALPYSDPLHPAAKPPGSHPPVEMVHKLRREREGASAIIDPPDDSGSRLEADGLHRGTPFATQFHNFKIVYKRYQGLYFAVCIDINDNELLHLEVVPPRLQLIHLFVENLDAYFGNVCELDIVFNFHKVYGILDEIIVGGEVLETAKDIIVNAIKNLEVED